MLAGGLLVAAAGCSPVQEAAHPLPLILCTRTQLMCQPFLEQPSRANVLLSRLPAKLMPVLRKLADKSSGAVQADEGT